MAYCNDGLTRCSRHTPISPTCWPHSKADELNCRLKVSTRTNALMYATIVGQLVKYAFLCACVCCSYAPDAMKWCVLVAVAVAFAVAVIAVTQALIFWSVMSVWLTKTYRCTWVWSKIMFLTPHVAYCSSGKKSQMHIFVYDAAFETQFIAQILIKCNFN